MGRRILEPWRTDTSEKCLKALSLVIPAYNEEKAIGDVVAAAMPCLAACAKEWEVLVVSDGSSDLTAQKARDAGATVLEHPENFGYGNAIKTGILNARHSLIAICDADGSYPLTVLEKLAPHALSYDMVVGSRVGREFYGGVWKKLARRAQLFLVQYATGMRIPDVNSGLRIFSRETALQHFDTLCGGFSFTTSITLAMLLKGHTVRFEPIDYGKRKGKSHVRYGRDMIRSLQIIVHAILKHNPIKMFLLLAIPPALLTLLALLGGVAAYILGRIPLFYAAMVLSACAFTTVFLVLGIGFLAVTVQTKDATSSALARRRP